LLLSIFSEINWVKLGMNGAVMEVEDDEDEEPDEVDEVMEDVELACSCGSDTMKRIEVYFILST
jgi:hypothetical protein